MKQQIRAFNRRCLIKYRWYGTKHFPLTFPSQKMLENCCSLVSSWKQKTDLIRLFHWVASVLSWRQIRKDTLTFLYFCINPGPANTPFSEDPRVPAVHWKLSDTFWSQDRNLFPESLLVCPVCFDRTAPFNICWAGACVALPGFHLP